MKFNFQIVLILTVNLILSRHDQCSAQSYPFWFLYPLKAGCGNIYTGYADNSIYPDSAAVRAIRNGYVNFAQLQNVFIQGGQAFWNTEYGMLWMGSSFNESIDSSYINSASNILTPADTLYNNNLVAVALNAGDCSSINKTPVNLKNMFNPVWTENLPAQDGYIYASGVAPEYYYETSSWWEAEKNARSKLARNMDSKIQSVEKIGYDNQTIVNEELCIHLRGIEVVERWRDLNEKIFYVLLRVPKF